MTCQQLGGPCDLAHTAATADEIIKAQDRHLKDTKDTKAAGDTTHQEAAAAMQARWRNPIKGMGWYKATKKAFADLPEH
jgi:hypothetical protein